MSVTSSLINFELRDRLRNEMNVTDEELSSLEKLLKIQRKKLVNERGSSRQPSIVIDHFLYHGDLGHAIDCQLLLDLQIQHIINLCDCSLDDQINEIFHVLWIGDLEDNFQGNIRRYFDQTNRFLTECKDKNEKVLVHCQAGISRSSSIVLAYLIKSDSNHYFHSPIIFSSPFLRHQQQSLEEAYTYLLERRPIAAPNYAFLIQLIRYEKELQSQSLAIVSTTL